MKRFFSILLSFALCFVSVNSTVFAEEKQSSIVSIDNVVGKVDETVVVPINIKNNPGIISLVTEISYDDTALKLISAKKNDEFWTSATMTSGGDLKSQPYRIIWYDGLAKSDFKEDGTLAELSFKVLKSGYHKIELSISQKDTFNNNFVKVPFEVDYGIIDISSGSNTTTTTGAATTTTTTSAATTTTTTSKVTTTTTTISERNGSLELNSITGSVGDTLNISIKINDNPGIISLVADIAYDNTALKLVSVSKNAEFWTSATMTPGGDLKSQPYRIIWYDGLAKSDFKENGTLAELSFEVLKSGSHEIKMYISEKDTFNNNFDKVPFDVIYGSIDVSAVEYKLGDVNNDGHINAVDASSVLSYYAMISTNKDGGFDEAQKNAADVNHDSLINAVDASCILSYYAYVSTTKEDILSIEEYLKKNKF